jgi:cation transport ATPase
MWLGEHFAVLDAVLFDKTGTLTRGAHIVTGVAAAPGHTEDQVRRIAGGVESDSEHPLARAIVAAARARGDIARARDFRSITGRGVEATVDASGTPSADQRCCGSVTSRCRPSWPREFPDGSSGARPCSTSSGAMT